MDGWRGMGEKEVSGPTPGLNVVAVAKRVFDRACNRPGRCSGFGGFVRPWGVELRLSVVRWYLCPGAVLVALVAQVRAVG